MAKAPLTRHLRIPVRSVEGEWEFSLGGRVPVTEATEAVLVVDRKAISDADFLELMERKARHKVLEEGTPLLVSLAVKDESPPPEKLKPLLKRYDNFHGSIAVSSPVGFKAALLDIGSLKGEVDYPTGFLGLAATPIDLRGTGHREICQQSGFASTRRSDPTRSFAPRNQAF